MLKCVLPLLVVFYSYILISVILKIFILIVAANQRL